MHIVKYLNIAVLSFLLTWSQPSEIKWSSNFRVAIKDFRSDISYGEGFANISTGFKYEYENEGTERCIINIYSFMDPDSSFISRMPYLIWSDSGRATLNHEQRHFDIAEINARNFKKKLSNYVFHHPYQRALDSIYSVQWGSLLEMQSLYDSETENGGLEKKQAEWDFKIDSILKNTKQFECTKVVVKIGP